jgi:uncharacterized membrane protein YuzA (DUF378 family)
VTPATVSLDRLSTRRRKRMKKLDAVALILGIVGALNWGLVAIAEFDLVAELFGLDFGTTNAMTRIVYGLVGVSGVWLAARFGALIARDRQRAAVVA